MGSKILAGRYELLEKKGDGGMAVVYKAKDRLLDRFVAIKILKPEFIRDPKFTDSFRRESQAAAGLSHPNIVSVYDVGKEGNIYYIVMELLDGDNLSDVIRRHAPLSEKRVIEVSKQVAAALSTAHKKKIIHRDVKPHNILIAEDGTVKIADFGIAKTVNSGTIVSSASAVMGSVHYLSPEQARGGYVDARSDIYSLGIVMYEMLTGKVPYDGENAVSVAMMHMNGNVPAPSIENPAVSALMDAIVLKATNKAPGDRFSSADELIEALNNAANGVAMAEADATSIYGIKDFYAVNKMNGAGTGSDEEEISSFEDLGLEEEIEEQKPSKGIASAVKGKGTKKSGRSKSMSAEESKKVKRSGILGIVLALICAIPLSVILLNSCSGAGSSGTVAIPDVRGMTETQAAAELESKGLEYKLGTPVLSEEYDAGEVVSTNPDIGEKVKKGYTVTLILSRGLNLDTVQVPTFVGSKLSEAVTLLEAYDLKQGALSYEDSDMPEGTIIRQTPSAGEEVETGTEIAFVISQGAREDEIEVPNLSGMTQSQAEAALEDKGLKLGKVSTAESDSEENTVIEQSPSAGSSAAEGDSVSITLSTGRADEPEPVDISMHVDYSSAQNEVFTLTVTVTDSNGLHYIVNNQQRIKSDGSETVVLSGEGKGTVRVIMDNEIVYEGTADFSTGELS